MEFQKSFYINIPLFQCSIFPKQDFGLFSLGIW